MVLEGVRARSMIKWKTPFLISGKGENYELHCISTDDGAISQGSCSILWQNKMYVYGGLQDLNNPVTAKQISLLDGSHFIIVGSLPFFHRGGSCSSMGNKFVFLCFSRNYGCRQATDPLGPFTQIEEQTYHHQRTQTSASNGKLRSFCHCCR